MITAEEARVKTAVAKKTGKDHEFQLLKNILSEKEQIILDSCEAGHSYAACALPMAFHHLTTEEIQNFVIQYFSAFGFTVSFNSKLAFRFVVSWRD